MFKTPGRVPGSGIVFGKIWAWIPAPMKAFYDEALVEPVGQAADVPMDANGGIRRWNCAGPRAWFRWAMSPWTVRRCGPTAGIGACRQTPRCRDHQRGKPRNSDPWSTQLSGPTIDARRCPTNSNLVQPAGIGNEGHKRWGMTDPNATLASQAKHDGLRGRGEGVYRLATFEA